MEPRQANHISLCICEKVAENGAFGGCFRHPFHHTLTGYELTALTLFRLQRAKRPESLRRRTVAHVFDIHSHSLSLPPHFLRGTYIGSTSSVPKMDSSPSTLRIMARGTYRTVSLTGLRPRLPIHRRPLSLGFYSLAAGRTL
jgi:hypothetical protein